MLHASRLVACALLYLVLLLSAVGPACLVCVQGPMETKKACEAAKRLLSAHRDALAVPMLDLMKVGWRCGYLDAALGHGELPFIQRLGRLCSGWLGNGSL